MRELKSRTHMYTPVHYMAGSSRLPLHAFTQLIVVIDKQLSNFKLKYQDDAHVVTLYKS